MNPIIHLAAVAILCSTAQAQQAPKSEPLDKVTGGKMLWNYSPSKESPGGKGSLTVVSEGPSAGKSAMMLDADFSGGGLYVMAQRKLDDLAGADIAEVTMQVKAVNLNVITVRLIDGSGQVHQKKIKVSSDSQWHELTIVPAEIAGGEHWGGANDGVWQGAPRMLALIFNKPKTGDPKATLFLADVNAKTATPASR